MVSKIFSYIEKPLVGESTVDNYKALVMRTRSLSKNKLLTSPDNKGTINQEEFGFSMGDHKSITN